MAISVDELRVFVNTTEDDDEELNRCIATAEALLAAHLVDTPDAAMVIPSAVMDRAHLLVAAEAFQQAKAPNGYLNQQYDDGSAAPPVRISTDPLRPAYPLLSRWVTPVTFS